MKTLQALNLNFNTLENSIKTVGSIFIIIVAIGLVINTVINPNDFNL